MKRFLGWITLRRVALGALLALYAAISLIGPQLDGGMPLLAAFFAQPALLGMWAVLGARPVYWQTMQALFLASIAFAVSTLGLAIIDWRRQAAAIANAKSGAAIAIETWFAPEILILVGVMYGISMLAMMLTFAACRVAFGWRLMPDQGRDALARITEGRRVSLRAIFIQTTLAAIPLALVSQLPLDWELSPDWYEQFDFDFLATVLGLALVVCPASWGLTLSILMPRGGSWRKNALAALLAISTSIAAVALLADSIMGIEIGEVFVFLLIESTTLAASLALLRVAGYRLMSRRTMSEQNPVIASSAPLPEEMLTAA